MTTVRSAAEDDLPALGDWDGPVHGELGVLAVEFDGSRVQCHACGDWFVSLGHHVRKSHDLLPDEYRAVFGLRASTGLVAPGLKQRLADLAVRNFRPYWPTAGAHAPPPDVRGRQWRLESKLDPHNQRVKAEHLARAREWTRELRAAGLWPQPPPDWRAPLAKAQARWRELLRDPAYRRLVGDRRAAVSVRKEFVCAGCGATFTRGRGRKHLRRYCDGCAAERDRRRPRRDTAGQAPRGGRSDVGYRETVARLRALDPAAFAALAEEDRTLVQRHYGLRDGRPVSQRELRAERGWTEWQLKQALVRSVRLLLGEVPFVRPVPTPCSACGRTFDRIGDRRFCSRACAQRARRMRQRPDSAALRALGAETFEALPPLERSAVRMYHGLDGEGPMTHDEVGLALGIGPMRVHELVETATARLLGRTRPRAGTVWQRRAAIAAVCEACGRTFSTIGEGRYCSEACQARRRREQSRPDLAAVLALDADAFAVLSPIERTVVAMYYGVDGRDPMGLKAIEAALRLGHGRAGALRRAAVARLLSNVWSPR